MSLTFMSLHLFIYNMVIMLWALLSLQDCIEEIHVGKLRTKESPSMCDLIKMVVIAGEGVQEKEHGPRARPGLEFVTLAGF